jgi:hypothetical protein
MASQDDLSGEARLRDLIETCYDLIETLRDGSSLRRLLGRRHGVPTRGSSSLTFCPGSWVGGCTTKKSTGIWM